MIPSMTNKTTEPPGVLSKRSGLILLAVIALIIVIASFFSGQPSKKRDQSSAATPSGANQAQLSAFMEALNRDKRQADEERRRLEEQRLAEERNRLAIPPPPRVGYYAETPPRQASPPVVDNFEQKRREREENAPFESNIALRIANAEAVAPHPATPPTETQSVHSDSDSKAVPKASAKVVGSGKFLPARETTKDGPQFRIYEGTLVETTLVTRLDGSFTGPVKCVVSREVRSVDNEAVLIPLASQFFGEAKRVEAQDQRRLAVTFKRLLLPNGYSIDLDDPGLSEAGETGLKDKTNNHYLRTFGITGAVGLLGGLALYGGQVSTAAPYAAGVANSTGSSATTILSRFLNVVPTITIREGHPVKVYIAADLLVPEYQPTGSEERILK
jgi:type IV secretion system protein TrbI